MAKEYFILKTWRIRNTLFTLLIKTPQPFRSTYNIYSCLVAEHYDRISLEHG